MGVYFADIWNTKLNVPWQSYLNSGMLVYSYNIYICPRFEKNTNQIFHFEKKQSDV